MSDTSPTIEELYQLAESKGWSNLQADRLLSLLMCDSGQKVSMMYTAFPVIACVDSASARRLMCEELAGELALEIGAVIIDFKAWWKEHSQKRGFPMRQAEDTVRGIPFHKEEALL